MKKNKLKKISWNILTLAVFFLIGSGVIHAEHGEKDSNSAINRLNLFLGGGYGYSESRMGLIDVKAEVQFAFSSKVYFGVGIGYLSDSDHDHMEGDFNFMSRRRRSGGMMDDMGHGMTGGFSGHQHDFTVIPLTASLYYSLPVNSRIDIFMSGGAGYYWGSFKDISKQKKNAFGPHTGLGVEYKITSRITAMAYGVYRFVNLDGFTSELHPGYRVGIGGEENEEGFWLYHHSQGEYHFHESHEDLELMMEDNAPFNISLNGFSLRMGIKFGF